MKIQHLFLKPYLLFSFVYLHGVQPIIAQSARPVPAQNASLSPSQEFSVSVDGKNVLVYSSHIPAAFCSFDINKPIEIRIKSLLRDIKWVDVRPLSSGIKPVFKNSDSSITFRITKPGQYSVELNGSIKIPLYLFANPPELDKPSKTDKNVRYYESGKIHYPGSIILRDNEQVYVEAGAIVVGNIRARNAKHIKISGRGIIDGSYSRQFMDSVSIVNKTNDTPIEPGRRGGGNVLFALNECNDVTIDGITIFNSQTWEVVPTLCNHVLINNIKIVSDHGGDDGIDIVSSKNVVISNSFVHTKDDCIAIKSQARPQPAAGQTSITQPAPGQPRPTQPTPGQLSQGPFYSVDSVLVKNCVFWNALWGNALEIGFELSGDVTNVSFIDNDIIHVEGGAAFSIHNARRGVVSDILVDDLRVEGTDQKLFDLAIFRSIYSEDGVREKAEVDRLYVHGVWDNVLAVPESDKESRMKYRGYIRNVTLKNVNVVDGIFPFSVFYGSDSKHLVENVVIENLKVHGRKITKIADAKFYLENTKNIILK